MVTKSLNPSIADSSSSSISVDMIERVRDENLKKLLSRKKLHLVLDLDNTLLHSISTQRLTKYDRDYLSRSVGVKLFEEKQLYQWNLGENSSKGRDWVTKLRPNVKSFLKEASTMFDFSIFTLGLRKYAKKMVELLDPEGLYFANSQVITREDIPSSTPLKKGLEYVMMHEKVVLIVDDTKEVWEDNAKNLIKIGRYEFFENGDDDKTSSKKSWTRNWADESEKYGELARVLRELKKIHKEFYDVEEGQGYEGRDVREAIDGVKRKFKLQGTKEGLSKHDKETIDEVDECFKLMGLNCRSNNRPSRIMHTSHVVM